MNVDLDYKFFQWLNEIAEKWNKNVDDIADELARNEIEDREECYSKFNSIFSRSKFKLDSFTELAQESWPLGGRFVIIRLNDFLKDRKNAERIIRRLVENFPKPDSDAIIRINDFIEDAVVNGYVNERNMPDRAGAALLASVILTSLFPNRFVDFRINRWERFHKIFYNDALIPKNNTYGEKIVWASNFAKDLARTKTFQKYWPDEPALWVISSFAWVGPSPDQEFISEKLEDDGQTSYPEGKWKERLHKYRERNTKVIKKAKALRLKKDPLLKCDVCGFSFVSHYGIRGKQFIEAHHTIPLVSLSPGDETKIEDIALVCSNCHSMIHYGEKTMSISELRNILR